MSEEKTLLEQVREKEIALADEYARACTDADARKEAAVRDGEETIEQADAEWGAAIAALEQMMKPDIYRQARYIKITIEERKRENLFRLKKVKRLLERRKRQSRAGATAKC